MTSILTISGLQILFFILLILEFIVPSAGIITVLAVASLGASWWMISESSQPGLLPIFLSLDLALIPIILWFGFRLLQKSPLANRIELSTENGYTSQGNLPQELTGKTGIATSTLRPYGHVEVDGQIYDATTQGDFITANTQVKIISTQHNRLMVEPIEGDRK